MSVLQGLVSTGGNLYAAFKGEPDDDRIFCAIFGRNGKWSNALTIAGNTSTGPSLGVFDNSVYAAWKGEWSDPRIFFSKYNGTQWEPQNQIPNIYSDTGPALCQLGTKQKIAAWKNVADQNLYYATFDGTNWSGQSQISGVGSSVGPSLAYLGGLIYAAWKGVGGDQGLYYATYDGNGWSTQHQIPGVASSVGPSLAAVGDRLYAVWKGESNDETLYYAYYPFGSGSTKTWSAQTPVPGSGSSIGAAISEFNGRLYAMAKGKDSDVSLFEANFDPTNSNWSAWKNDIPGNTGPDPLTLLAPPAGGDVNYLMADNNGAAVTGATVTIMVLEDIVVNNKILNNAPTAGPVSYAFQVNCYSPGFYNSQVQAAKTSEAFVWQQFIISFIPQTAPATGFEICVRLNCFRMQDYDAKSQYINWDTRVSGAAGVVVLPNNSNVLPKGWQITLRLTNTNDNLSGFNYSVAQPNGTVFNSPQYSLTSLQGEPNPVVTGTLAPILNYQASLIGLLNHEIVDFLGGQGIFLYYADKSLTATAPADETGEQSTDVTYSALPASYPNGEFYQTFGA
jgi:hypothetical protein